MTKQLHSWAFIPEKTKRRLHQDLYTNVNSSFTCNSQKVEMTQMTVNG